MQDEAEYRAVLDGLRDVQTVLDGHPELRSVMASPLLNKRKKAEVLRAVIERGDVQVKAGRLVGLLLEHGRLPLLGEVIAAVPELWNERQGVLSFEVASVIPLTKAQQERLAERLAAVEGRPVSLVYRIDRPNRRAGRPARHIIYDASLRGGLQRLRDRIEQE
jgi:ATP synthase F1 delta subunit